MRSRLFESRGNRPDGSEAESVSLGKRRDPSERLPRILAETLVRQREESLVPDCFPVALDHLLDPPDLLDHLLMGRARTEAVDPGRLARPPVGVVAEEVLAAGKERCGGRKEVAADRHEHGLGKRFRERPEPKRADEVLEDDGAARRVAERPDRGAQPPALVLRHLGSRNVLGRLAEEPVPILAALAGGVGARRPSVTGFEVGRFPRRPQPFDERGRPVQPAVAVREVADVEAVDDELVEERAAGPRRADNEEGRVPQASVIRVRRGGLQAVETAVQGPERTSGDEARNPLQGSSLRHSASDYSVTRLPPEPAPPRAP